MRLSDFTFFDNLPDTASGSRTALTAGWTLGGGAEIVLNQNLTLKAGYLHVDFGDRLDHLKPVAWNATPTEET